MPIRLLIADDHPLIRSGLVSMFAETDIEVVAQASTGDEAVHFAKEHQPDVVLLDVRLNGEYGFDALSRIQSEYALPVLMFSNHDNLNYMARAVALGAYGYLLKDITRQELDTEIRKAAQGRDSWSPEQLRKAGHSLGRTQTHGDLDVALTRREMEVLRLMADGLTNNEIAGLLHISPETVKEHVKHILSKVGVSDRTQAAVWAVRNGVA